MSGEEADAMKVQSLFSQVPLGAITNTARRLRIVLPPVIALKRAKSATKVSSNDAETELSARKIGLRLADAAVPGRRTLRLEIPAEVKAKWTLQFFLDKKGVGVPTSTVASNEWQTLVVPAEYLQHEDARILLRASGMRRRRPADLQFEVPESWKSSDVTLILSKEV
jgi:hypothetical protein